MNNSEKAVIVIIALFLAIFILGSTIPANYHFQNTRPQDDQKNDSIFSTRSTWFNNSSYIRDTMMEIRAAGKDYSSSRIKINKKYILNYSEDTDFIYIEMNITAFNKKQRD